MTTIDQFSVIPLLLFQLFKGQVIGLATGFVWKATDNTYYIVTNYHVVSGMRPVEETVIDDKGRIPDKIRVLHNGKKLGTWIPADYPVVDSHRRPLWLEHPLGSTVDVVALPISIPAEAEVYPLNSFDLTKMELRPAEPVSIVGYPHGQTAGHFFAIWQTGFIASEPNYDFGDLPALLVDSRAWPGNSGSPVIARRYGAWQTKQTNSFGSQATDFVGIFSGRIGPSEMKLVWKPRVIEEILRAQSKNSPP